MKRLLALSAAICLLGAAAPANYNAFGVAVLQRLGEQSATQNVFISPVSIGVAMAMAADGAAGSTRVALLHGLRFDGSNLASANAALIASLRSNHDAQVGIADAIWLRNDIPPRAQYVSLLQSSYDAQAQALHFGDPSAAAAINAWTKLHTLGLIDHLIDSTNPLDFAFLTNALAFEGKWSVPFEHSATSSQPFTDASGLKHNVQMMSRTGSFEGAVEPSFRALRLPYGSGGYAAYVLLPNGSNVNAFLRTLSASTFDRLARSVQDEELAVELPRFTATYQADLNDVLSSLGMGIAFSSEADFSPMTGQRVRIADVRHKAYVRVDEAGTVAAAATSVGMRMTAIRLEPTPLPFIVDRPFVFALRDERTGALLFIGVIRTIPPA